MQLPSSDHVAATGVLRSRSSSGSSTDSDVTYTEFMDAISDTPPDRQRLSCCTRSTLRRSGGLAIIVGGGSLLAATICLGWPIWLGMLGAAFVACGVLMVAKRESPQLHFNDS